MRTSVDTTSSFCFAVFVELFGKPGSKGAPDIYLPAPSFRRHDARGLLADDYYVVWGRSFRRSVRLHTLDTHGVRIPIHAHSAERK